MDSEERAVWRYLVREANRLGHMGQRVTAVGVICPTGAADNYTPMLITDNGPTSATEAW